LREKCLKVSDGKIKGRIFVSSQIRELMNPL
jgi:hypothetical protein